MPHISTLIHLALFAGFWILLAAVAKGLDAGRMQVATRLIRLSLGLMLIDLAVGFFGIDYLYGSTPSANWMSKSVMVVPLLLAGSIVRMFRFRRAVAETVNRMSSGDKDANGR